ncbi:uncharacterized protein [Emydura macquarii macquarii]|uniref:uncharacterized protein n=1 Tax=Emydura macquarii macquarii TaxID=1129001 RepID=UPI00352B0E64
MLTVILSLQAGFISWHFPMALSTCSGRDEGYKLVVRGHFEAGMRELVCFTQYLLEAEADLDACGKIQKQIEAASRELSAAEEELGRQLAIIDKTTEELVVKKKSLQDEQDEKKQSLARLKIELDSCCESERKVREMLETAKKYLCEMQAELQRRKDESWNNQLVRDIGIGLMFIPILGTLAGSIMVGCGHTAMNAAERAAHEAQDAVNRHTNEESTYSAEVCRYTEQQRQMEAEIKIIEKRLDQIEPERQALAVEHGEIVALQKGLRKCVTFMNGLAGKVSVTERLTKNLLIYELLAHVLGDVVHHVLPLMSPGGEAGTEFLAVGDIQGHIEKLKLGSHGLKALADAEAAAIEY